MRQQRVRNCDRKGQGILGLDRVLSQSQGDQCAETRFDPQDCCLMGCRIGMATDVAERVRQLKADGVVPRGARFRTLDSGLTYSEANRREILRRDRCGSGCEGSPGGGYVSGRVWSVYRIDW